MMVAIQAVLAAGGGGGDFNDVWAYSNEGAMGVGFFQYILLFPLTKMTVLIVVVSL